MEPTEAPAVTVVIPTANRPELLRRAVTTVLEQDYEGPLDCLVVFDGEECELPAPSGRRNRTVHGMPNTSTPGLAGARNTGILASTTPIVAFLDDDDEWLSEKLSRQIALLEQRPDAAAVGCGNVVVYDGHETIRPAPDAITFGDLLRSRVAVLHSSTIVLRRADVLERIGLIDEDVPAGASEDYEWQLRAARHGPILMVRDPLTRINWHAGSRFSRQWDSLVAGLKYVLAKNPEFDTEPRGASRIYGQIAFAYAAMGRTRHALRWAFRCMTTDWRQPRAYISLLVAARVLPPEAVLRQLHLRGKGI